MAIASDVSGEEYYQIAIGSGMYTSELPSNIPDGYSPICYNMVATGDSLENRIGIKRSSVDWKVGEYAPTTQSIITSDDTNYFCQIAPWSNDSDKVAFAWGAYGLLVPGLTVSAGPTLNLVRASGTAGSGDGFISVAMPNSVIGICQYNGSIYFSLSTAGVQKITAINWAADTVTYGSVLSSAGGTLKGLFTFKDRLWGWSAEVNSHKLYFTDLPSVGGQPETWAFAANVVPFVGPNGAGQIKKIVPLGNRLIVFTTNGLFTLLVEGPPASWILRVLDSRSLSTCSQSAFEARGVVYYINTAGVWATNGLAATKISGVIEDQFFLAEGTRMHTLVSYEDGMIASVAKATPANINFFDGPNCKIFYSKLDPIAWTEWNVNKYNLGTSAYRMTMILSVTDKIPTYLNAEPTVYAMVHITDSSVAQLTYSILQLLVFDGGSDQYVNKDNIVETLSVGIYLKTKHFDGDNQYNYKRAKRGMLELYTSDAEHEFSTSWDIDSTTSVATEVRTTAINDFTVGVGSNLIKILNSFYYRRASFNLRASLQTDNSQIKIKNLAIAQDTGKAEEELIR